MRNSPSVGGLVCPETYHGTRMDEKALEFHTQLHEWSEAQKISAQANKHVQLLTKARQKEIYLPFKKLTQIEHWTKDVNRFYRPYKGDRPKSGHFMKIDVTKYNMRVDKKPEETRSKSAIYSTSAMGKGYRVLSAVSASNSGVKRRFFGTDCHTVNNKLIDSQMHYSAQRQEIRSATFRRPITSAKTVETKNDTDANMSININGLDKVEPSESETLSTFGNISTKRSSVDSQDQTKHQKQGQGQIQGQTEADILQQKITARSWSNRMLNVISIDDCKLTCRYRPQTLKESQALSLDSDELDQADDIQTKINQEQKIDKSEPSSVERTDNDVEDDDVSDIKLDIRLNGMIIGDISRDTNNNLDDQDSDADDESDISDNDSELNNSIDESPDQTARKKVKVAKSKSKKNKGKKDSISFQDKKTSNSSNASKAGKRTNSSSSETNKTSYGRVTSLYTHSQSSKSKEKSNKKKKVTRVAKINKAINNMVQDRRVLNSMDRDFDTRTAEFGRTVVDKSEGSELFQKLHSNLRKKMDTFFDTHSAVKTLKFYEAKRRNSEQGQTETKGTL